MSDGRRYARVLILSGICIDFKENGEWNRARFTIEDAIKTALG